METKQVIVECPCCEGRLEIDVRTSKVVRWRSKGEVDEAGKPVLDERDWGQASDRVTQRLDMAKDKFDQSLSREKKRAQDLDDLFRKASEKLRDPEDG